MNKRIDELFGQTMDQAVPETWTTLTHAQLLIVKDKFAELIVRECMEVASPNYMSTPEDSVYYVEQAINRIAKHFGVEE